MQTQKQYNWEQTVLSDKVPGINTVLSEEVASAAHFVIDANLLALNSNNEDGLYTVDGNCWDGGQDKYSIDVSGVQVVWGSRIGHSDISLNSQFVGETEDTSNYCVKMYDVKSVGNWNDQADGPDIVGGGSYSSFTYTQASDDNIKVASDMTLREHSTVLQGSAGSAVMLGSYGKTRVNGIKGSKVDGVYVHRSLQNDFEGGGCGSSGNTAGLISTRSCAEQAKGLTDATVTNLHVPALGSNSAGANSVGQPFGIGVWMESMFCDGITPKDPYPISNLAFTNIYIDVNPSCPSRFYDDSGNVAWGDDGSPSAIFYGTDNGNCDYEGAVEFSSNQEGTAAYFVCGADSEEDAQYCMSTAGVGGVINVNYTLIENGANPNIAYPYCKNANRNLRTRQ